MHEQPRYAAATLRAVDIPIQPGVYAWYRDGEALYVGRAKGRRGLRERIARNHLGTGPDLSRSSFRRDVCEYLAIAPTSVTRQRPAALSAADVAAVNLWVRQCAVAWIVCATPDDAADLEDDLKAEWMPPLSRR